jgi:hypothetical protein
MPDIPTLSQAPAGMHWCRECCNRLVPDAVNFCDRCRLDIQALVGQFNAYMQVAGHLGPDEIRHYRNLERMLKEDNREHK